MQNPDSVQTLRGILRYREGLVIALEERREALDAEIVKQRRLMVQTKEKLWERLYTEVLSG